MSRSKDSPEPLTPVRLVALLRETASILEGSDPAAPVADLDLHSLEPGARSLRILADSVERSAFVILFVGEFKSGKSTVINSLLGQQVLPARAVPTTALITHVGYGESACVEVFERGRPPRQISLEEFQQEFTFRVPDSDGEHDEGDLHHIDYDSIRYPHPFLQQGITLIDTPGIGYDLLTRAFRGMFREAVARADMIVHIMSAYHSLTFADRELIQSVSDNPARLLFAVNWHREIADELERVKAYLAKELAGLLRGLPEREREEVVARQVVFVDARSALQARLTQPYDQEQLDRSGLSLLELRVEEHRARAWESKRTATIRHLVVELDHALGLVQERRELVARHLEAATESWRRVYRLGLRLNDDPREEPMRAGSRLDALDRRLREIRGRAAAPSGDIAVSAAPPSAQLGRSNTALPRRLRVFLCHSSEDKPAVRELYRTLGEAGVAAWLDEVNLIPGQHWEREIRNAMKEMDAVIVCLSTRSVNRAGYVHKEINLALDVADQQPEGTIFTIPLRLDGCVLPDRLSRLHWVDYFQPNGFENLMRALRVRAHGLGLTLS
ncbi:MAG TPA: TIR domain-containing protein [Longimicrobium sp.]|nr:TIR domain-containing protein [Longimicrobium sp.]